MHLHAQWRRRASVGFSGQYPLNPEPDLIWTLFAGSFWAEHWLVRPLIPDPVDQRVTPRVRGLCKVVTQRAWNCWYGIFRHESCACPGHKTLSPSEFWRARLLQQSRPILLDIELSPFVCVQHRLEAGRVARSTTHTKTNPLASQNIYSIVALAVYHYPPGALSSHHHLNPPHGRLSIPSTLTGV
jgi:hypothetical protein